MDWIGARKFQSTLPAWGETFIQHGRALGIINFNPLSPHGERRAPAGYRWPGLIISIHSPRMGRDNPLDSLFGGGGGFQSTLPAWGETLATCFFFYAWEISIHSPRMGRDMFCTVLGLIPSSISIHSPRMGRDKGRRFYNGKIRFQSTLPAWGETVGLAGNVG